MSLTQSKGVGHSAVDDLVNIKSSSLAVLEQSAVQLASADLNGLDSADGSGDSSGDRDGGEEGSDGLGLHFGGWFLIVRSD